MKSLVFSVFDGAVKAYLPPFMSRSRMEAIRSFADAIANKDHQFAKHAKDFTLVELGLFDDETGRYENREVPEVVITGLQAKADENPV